MVYQDLSENSQSSFKHQTLAPVQDRFLAFAFDAALCFPTLFIFLKPLWKKIQYLSLTAIDSMELKVLLVLGAFFSILLFVAFNAFCLYRWGATPGKRIFQVRVVSINGNERLGFSQAALRSCVWAWQIICLGIPFMEVLSHKDRRPWHDRLGETLVVTDKKIHSESPHWIEQHFFRNLYWAVFSVLAVTVGLEVRGLLRESFKGDMKREELVQEGYLCSNLSEALPADANSSRLDYGLGLFLLGHLNSECLESELDFVLWSQNQEELPWAYLTRAFLSEASGNEAQEDFAKACPESDGSAVCAITKWKRDGETSDLLKSTWLYRVAHMKELVKAGDFTGLKAHINSVRWPQALISYVQAKGLQSLFVRGEKTAFEETFPILASAWDHDLKMEMGSWGCLAQLTEACDSRKALSSCDSLRLEMSHPGERAWPRPVTLALAKESVCRGRVDKEAQAQFTRAFLKSKDTAWVKELLEMQSFDDRSWQTVSEALKQIPSDDWLYAQALWYLSQGAVTRERQKVIGVLFEKSGSEDLFWWLAKNEYNKRVSPTEKEIPMLKMRVPTSASDRQEKSQ